EHKLYFTGKGPTSDPSDYDIYTSSLLESGDLHAIGSYDKLQPLYAERMFDAQPAVSPDGLRLYFASERIGGRGGVDLWMSSRTSALGMWSAPQVLESVNTACNELSPSVSY